MRTGQTREEGTSVESGPGSERRVRAWLWLPSVLGRDQAPRIAHVVPKSPAPSCRWASWAGNRDNKAREGTKG